MEFTIQSFVTDDNGAVITRKDKAGKTLATVCYLGDNVLNHNGSFSRFALTIWLQPKEIELGVTKLRGNLIRQVPFTKADGTEVLRNVVVAEGIEYDRASNEFYTVEDQATVPEYTTDNAGNQKPNWLIRNYVNMKEYYASLSSVEVNPASTNVGNVKEKATVRTRN